jgi:hypothetical protein
MPALCLVMIRHLEREILDIALLIEAQFTKSIASSGIFSFSFQNLYASLSFTSLYTLWLTRTNF